MKKLLLILMAAFIIIMSVGSLVSCGPAEPEGPVTLRVATPWPPGDPPTERIKEMAARFNGRAGGKCTIEVHPGESLVKTQESMDAVRTGAVEMAGFPIGVFTSLDPRFAAAEVPFMYNGAEADGAAQEYLIPMYNEFMPDKFNQKMMSSFTCSGLEIASTKQVKTLEDLKGMLIHSISPVCSQVIEAMGAAPVSAPFVEGYTVIEKKVCDATMVATMFMVIFKLSEVADYLTTGYLIPASLGLTINMDAYESLPNDIRKLLDEECDQLTRDANKFFVAQTDESPKTLASQGMEIYVLPAAERARWRDTVWHVSEKIIADMGEDWGKRFLEVADKVNKQYPY
jgi:TRAP-type C4-dicarboxylate transport system substrate-binding protein